MSIGFSGKYKKILRNIGINIIIKAILVVKYFYQKGRNVMAEVYIFLADGFEEIEALTVVDLLRRADIGIEMISIAGKKEVKGSHGITVIADRLYEMDAYMDGSMLVLPGGMPGTNALMAHEGLRDLLFEYRNADKCIAAICAAPSVLGMNGILRGKNAVCFPGFEDKLLGANLCRKERVVTDGNVITSRGFGTAIEFALAIIKKLRNDELADKMAHGIQFID